jgi:hypothetical protein
MKSNKRPLDKVELDVCKKQIERIEARDKWLRFQAKHTGMMLDEGLELNYLKTMREYKDSKKEIDDELGRNEEIVRQVQDQIKNGVEIKNIQEVSIEEKEDNEKRDRKYIG